MILILFPPLQEHFNELAQVGRSDSSACVIVLQMAISFAVRQPILSHLSDMQSINIKMLK